MGCRGRVNKSTELKLWCFCSAECGFESRSWHLCPWARHLTKIASLHPGVMGTCEGRDGSCDWFSQVAHILLTGCILPRELRWFKEWFKAQWPGVIMSEAFETPLGREKHYIKTVYYYYYYYVKSPGEKKPRFITQQGFQPMTFAIPE